ncbi:MAG TPA: FAD-dependent monooxygenase [Bryobacteraceae bacterium]|jgi:flavin-dependent dehydrogenase|nr:FAD-dependent monooxygenase [Bryobacteraceae bacterium]
MALVAVPDVFVIGGGPAGLAAAIAARQRGLCVTLADGQRPPIDKACGEGMLPDGFPAARQIGLDLDSIEHYPVRGIRFCAGDASMAADFPDGPGMGVRRTTLHREMVKLAEAHGVDLQWGRPVNELRESEARWIVGADGANSRVRSWAGLDDAKRDTRRFGFRLHFRVRPWSEYVEVHWGAGCQIYVTPVSEREVGIALLTSDSRLRVREGLRQFPELWARLDGAAETSGERGAATSMRQLRRVMQGNVALLGDASGSVDAITGEGLCLGFHQAIALADAMACDDLPKYEAAHRNLARRPRFMANLLLTMDRMPKVRRPVFTLLSAYPRLFEAMLAMHVGGKQGACATLPVTR